MRQHVLTARSFERPDRAGTLFSVAAAWAAASARSWLLRAAADRTGGHVPQAPATTFPILLRVRRLQRRLSSATACRRPRRRRLGQA